MHLLKPEFEVARTRVGARASRVCCNCGALLDRNMTGFFRDQRPDARTFLGTCAMVTFLFSIHLPRYALLR
jgi:hypothetical protein